MEITNTYKRITKNIEYYRDYYLNCIKELQDMFEKYSKYNLNNLYEEIKNNCNKVEYSKGGVGFRYGMHSPELLFKHMIKNCTVGRKIKNIEKGYNYKYYFDDKDRVTLIEKYLDGSLTYYMFFMHNEGYDEIILYEVKKERILYTAKAEYNENNKIKRYIENSSAIYPWKKIIDNFEEQKYTYNEDSCKIEYNYVVKMCICNDIDFIREEYMLENDKLTKVKEAYKKWAVSMDELKK